MSKTDQIQERLFFTMSRSVVAACISPMRIGCADTLHRTTPRDRWGFALPLLYFRRAPAHEQGVPEPRAHLFRLEALVETVFEVERCAAQPDPLAR